VCIRPFSDATKATITGACTYSVFIFANTDSGALWISASSFRVCSRRALSRRAHSNSQLNRGHLHRALLQRLDLRVQPALVAGCLVLMYKPFSGHAVQHGNRLLVSILCGCLIASFNSVDDPLNVRSHHRAHASVSYSVRFCLPSTFFGLGGVCQLVLLEENVIQNSPVSSISDSAFQSTRTTLSVRSRL